MKYFLFSLLIMITATSCYHVYYAPNTANAPLLSEKGEVRVNGLYSSGSNSEFEGGELQVAAAVSNNIGVMMNGMTAGNTDEVSDYYGGNVHKESGKGSYIEFAGGLFKSFDEKKKWIGEVYGGVGFGSVHNTYDKNEASRVGISKFFLQPAVGYKTSYFEFSIVPRISLINWKVRKDDLSPADPNSADGSAQSDLLKIRDRPSLFNFEPAFLLRAGAKNVKLQAGLSFSNSKNDYYPVETLNASLGVSVNLKGKTK